MPKVRKAPPPQIYHFHAAPKPNVPENDFNEISSRNSSSSPDTNIASREGFDYGKWKKGKINSSYKAYYKSKEYDDDDENGLKTGHLKKAWEQFIEELQEQQAQDQLEAELVRQEAMRQDAIKAEMRREEMIDTNQKIYDKKVERMKDEQRADNITGSSKKAVQKTYNESVSKKHQVVIPKTEHQTPSTTDILLNEEIDIESKDQTKK